MDLLVQHFQVQDHHVDQKLDLFDNHILDFDVVVVLLDVADVEVAIGNYDRLAIYC